MLSVSNQLRTDQSLSKIENSFFWGIILISVLLSIYLITTMLFYQSLDKLSLISAINFIRHFNFILSVLAVASCLMSYNRSKKENIFIIALMYLGLSTGILFGQVDYLTFLSNELVITNYITVSASLLRIGILLIVLQKNSKLKQLILSHKKKSILFVILFTMIFGFIERIVNSYGILNGNVFFIGYNLFLFICYTSVSIHLFMSGFKEKDYLFPILSSSIFMLALKALYAIIALNGSVQLSLNVKLMSVAITYIGFLIVIAGNFVDLFLSSLRIKLLNNKLTLFYKLTDDNKHSYMFLMDEEWNILYANKKMQEYYHETDLHRLNQILPPYMLAHEKNHLIRQHLNQTGKWRGSLNVDLNNVKRTVDCSIQVITENDGKKEIAVTYFDKSKELELEKLKVYDHEKTQFISNLSHELKTPLNVFCSVIQLLNQMVNVNDEKFKQIYLKYRTSLDVSGKRMTKLVNNLMDISKIEMNTLVPHFHNYQVIRLLQDVTAIISAHPCCESVSIKFQTDINQHLLKCDGSMIERILCNLLSNAIKFSSPSTTITVRTLIEEEWFVLEVQDEGIGITAIDQSLIFERFVQVDKSLTRINEGIGMGLYMVKSLVSLHGGKIELESAAHKGSTFKILLPNLCLPDTPCKSYEPDTYKIELELADIKKS
ncbi:sensor histidine kinase [Turicibacter sanguinis]|uniref:sensor histidine kinase n=1 Tax=Turicibacter sanguinis TaxID=154288 RepID=UPI0021D4BC47|nr:HAMP domain-containing sensor histidine kinase [Turicibacter sanguinis]MCU7192743.1 HAMP domain-containing histidine kinase [Turicibacter sanguinis]